MTEERLVQVKHTIVAIFFLFFFGILAMGFWYLVGLFVPRLYLAFFSFLSSIGLVIIAVFSVILFIKNRLTTKTHEVEVNHNGE
ncbi:hypothetical protein [Candidatus Borrarchaeum sp.]|uniref:hypothetical protein n=1 Tax=Candidatus Borrarchaeum sp. TaxID=2846742 RepID=UPI00257B14F9|nr:hypothetical protein [Candidatus Borrarchaeum sp.]